MNRLNIFKGSGLGIVVFSLLIVFANAFGALPVSARPATNPNTGPPSQGPVNAQGNPIAQPSIPVCGSGLPTGTPCSDPALSCTQSYCDLIAKYLAPAINVFSVSFGLIAVISLILGGINYTTSEGDPQKVQRAKLRIRNTIIALVAYIFLYAFLQFLIPGGIFRQ